MRLTQEYTADIEHRFKYATIAVLVLFVVIVARLYSLQVIKGRFYNFFSTENSIKAIKVPAVRGMIFDRRGQVLVENRPSFAVVVVPQYVVNPEKMIDSLHRLLGLSREHIREIWDKRRLQPFYRPLVIKSEVSQNEVAIIRARKNPWNDDGDEFDLRGVDVEVRYRRTYPESNIATHVLGYVREISPEKLKELRKTAPGRYRMGDMIGVQGLEEVWDQLLRGADGYQERIVNAVGREVDYEGIASELENRPAVAGASLKLTIDRDLQELARDLYAGRKGAVVVLDVKTGGVLALYSAPSYDLNRLAGPGGSEYWIEIASDPKKPLFNRAIQGGHPPGSTYKVVTAIAALAEGEVKPDETVHCGGALLFGGRPYRCWKRGGHGSINVHRAIVSSCNVFFYNMGIRLGVDRLAKYANMLGLGRKTGIPLPGERAGNIPTSAWKESRFGVPWQGGETLSIAVGQGYNVVTPLQNALVAAQIANGGKRLDVHLVEAAYDVDGKEVFSWKPPKNEDRLPIDPEIIEAVRKAMVGVVSEPGGTGQRQASRKVTMGGKTGTAQVVQLGSGAACRGDACRDHAWFISFAPADRPEVAAAAVVEHGGFGSAAAAPVIGEMFDRWWMIENGEPTSPPPRVVDTPVSEEESDY
ncbi:MAG TPA: penicillin-binding protein 2 [bacterium]|nr:penicillin-binding protein 2 [bacterium]